MTTAEFIEALQSDLREIAALGDEAIVEASERLVAAIRSSVGLRLLDVLGEAALEISAQLPSGHVELRMSGQDAEFVFVPEEESPGSFLRRRNGSHHSAVVRVAQGERRGCRGRSRRLRQHLDRSPALACDDE
jgi:hypothetical protein